MPAATARFWVADEASAAAGKAAGAHRVDVTFVEAAAGYRSALATG